MQMEDTSRIEPWLGRGFACSCGKQHEIPLKKVVIAPNATSLLPDYCKREKLRKVVIVADPRTKAIAGDSLQAKLTAADIEAGMCLIGDNEIGEVVADERAIVQVLLSMTPQTEALIAVGSGTIHDIVRFVCHKTGSAFVSIPTAPSVDGFSSVGAPLIIEGFKQTIPACAPLAIFADLDILSKAPQPMVAAGFADMLGKYTSMADWELGHLILQEHYCPVAADMTRKGLQLCIDHIEEIGGATPKGMRKLMEGLILSGISMLMVGNSRPASGSEHHLSHYWEMKFIQEKRKALLHGAKVGVAAVIMAEKYASIRDIAQDEVQVLVNRGEKPTDQNDRQAIEQAYGAIAPQVLQENFPHGAASRDLADNFGEKIVELWQDIVRVARHVPTPAQLSQWLSSVGGPTAPEQLGISPQLVKESLRCALFVRNRFTILRLRRWI